MKYTNKDRKFCSDEDVSGRLNRGETLCHDPVGRINYAKWLTGIILVASGIILGYPALGEVRAAAKKANPIVESSTCLDCHDDYASTLKHTAHSGAVTDSDGLSCVACHSGAEVHIEDPDETNITNPVKLSAVEQTALCADCHRPHTGKGNQGLDPHLEQGLNCLDCHSVHKGQEKLLSANITTLCESCHQNVSSQFQSRSNHPLGDGIVNCTSCHSFTGATEPNFGHGGSANCYSCHPEQTGPHLFEHPVTISFSTEGDGCTSCHFGHGGPNDRLLKIPDNNLCQSCHGTPPLHRSKHSGLGAKLPCLDCHSQTHGSNDNRLMLDPDLGSKLFPNCYQSGCHNLSN